MVEFKYDGEKNKIESIFISDEKCDIKSYYKYDSELTNVIDRTIYMNIYDDTTILTDRIIIDEPIWIYRRKFMGILNNKTTYSKEEAFKHHYTNFDLKSEISYLSRLLVVNKNTYNESNNSKVITLKKSNK